MPTAEHWRTRPMNSSVPKDNAFKAMSWGVNAFIIQDQDRTASLWEVAHDV